MTYALKKITYCGKCGIELNGIWMKWPDVNHAYREAEKYNMSHPCGCQVEVIEIK